MSKRKKVDFKAVRRAHMQQDADDTAHYLDTLTGAVITASRTSPDYSLEVKGVSLVIGSPGLGKSISLRRFKEDLSTQYFQPFYLWNTRTSTVGFLHSLCRIFQIQPYHYIADMFDVVSEYLGSLEENTRKYLLLIFYDFDNLSREILENIRLLMNYQMDSEERFSLVMSGTEKLQTLLREYAHTALPAEDCILSSVTPLL